MKAEGEAASRKNSKIWPSDCNRLFTADRRCGRAGARSRRTAPPLEEKEEESVPRPAVGLKLREMLALTRWLCPLCARRLPLSPVLPVHGVGRDREAPPDLLRKDAHHVQQ